jgi:hypothetical protein
VFTAPLHINGSYSILACVFVAAGICLPSRCLTMNDYSDFNIPAFERHVTISLWIQLVSYIHLDIFTTFITKTSISICIIIVIIQFNSLLFMCRVNSQTANYRHSTVQMQASTSWTNTNYRQALVEGKKK